MRRLPFSSSQVFHVWRCWTYNLKINNQNLGLISPPAAMFAVQLTRELWLLSVTPSCRRSASAQTRWDNWAAGRAVTLPSLCCFQDDELQKLRESFRMKLVETLSSELHPSLLTAPNSNPQTAAGHASRSQHGREDERLKLEKEEGLIPESKLEDFRKRLRDFLDLKGSPGPKRRKRDDDWGGFKWPRKLHSCFFSFLTHECTSDLSNSSYMTFTHKMKEKLPVAVSCSKGPSSDVISLCEKPSETERSAMETTRLTVRVTGNTLVCSAFIGLFPRCF